MKKFIFIIITLLIVSFIYAQSSRYAKLDTGHTVAKLDQTIDKVDSLSTLINTSDSTAVFKKVTTGELTVNGCTLQVNSNSNIDAVGTSQRTYFGGYAGNNQTNGSAFGYEALKDNTQTGCNAFGYGALGSNSGISSCAFGVIAGSNNSGTYCNAFGNSALNTNSGDSSNAFGYEALNTNSGDSSNAFGRSALKGNTAIGCNAFGHGAAINNQGINICAFGGNALKNNTQQRNTAMGNESFTNNSSYSNSTALGYNATPDASNQVMLGDTLVTEVKTAGSYIGASLNTGQGAYELYAMNQDVESTDDVTYNSVSLTKDLELDTTPGSDHTAAGIKGTFTNGNAGSVAFGDVCYIAADGDMEFADADAAATMPGIYMALETIATTASGEWLKLGWARDDTWTWTVGGLIYISVTGTTENILTQTAPSGAGDQVQIIGIATHADRIDFNPNLMLIEIGA